MERYMDGLIVSGGRVLDGDAHIAGTEIGVEELYELHEDGDGRYSSPDLITWYDLEIEQVDAAIEYARTSDEIV